MIGAEACERAVHRLGDELGRPLGSRESLRLVAALGHQHKFLTPVPDSLADERLRARIAFRRVNDVDSRVQKQIQDSRHLLLFRRQVAKRSSSEAQRRHLQPGSSEHSAFLHGHEYTQVKLPCQTPLKLLYLFAPRQMIELTVVPNVTTSISYEPTKL